jgi:glycosyltransferase involved in cell wall biosynthesis
VIAIYNAESSIRKTLLSALEQTYEKVEIIVIDGKSVDGTWRIIEEFSESIAFKISEKDRGIADAYNKGITAAKGEWIYFLNADDVFADKNVLSTVFSDRQIRPETNIIAGSVLSTDGRLFDGRFDWRLLIRNQVHHQAIFYRSRFLKHFPYNVDYRSYGHDHEHNIHVWRRREPVEYLGIVVAIWARGGISDKANWKQYREEFRVRRNSVGAYGWPFNIFTVLRFGAKRLRQG